MATSQYPRLGNSGKKVGCHVEDYPVLNWRDTHTVKIPLHVELAVAGAFRTALSRAVFALQCPSPVALAVMIPYQLCDGWGARFASPVFTGKFTIGG